MGTVAGPVSHLVVREVLIRIFAWPVFLLALWRRIQIANSEERLRPEYQRKANVGAIIVGIPLLLALSFACCACFSVLAGIARVT